MSKSLSSSLNVGFLVLSLVLIALANSISTADYSLLKKDSHCYGLAIEGGGDVGAWEVGALKALFNKYDHGYQVISGVSIGSINGGYIGTYKREDQKKGLDQLFEYWKVLS